MSHRAIAFAFVGVLFCRTVVSAQSITIVATTDAITTTISDARVEVDTNIHYQLGSGHSFESTYWFYVTDPVAAPPGISLRPTSVQIDQVKEVEFIDWHFKLGTQECTKARLTTADGSRDVFLWNLGYGSNYTPLRGNGILISGKILIEGKEQQVQIRGPFKTLTITKR